MHRLLLALAAAMALASTACSSSSSGPSGSGGMDSGSGSDTGSSCAPIDSGCGQPCDPGNSLGVGKYCTTAVCSGNGTATLCSVLGDNTTHFCTFRCSVPDAGAADAALPFPTSCGEGASCTCDNMGNCGCTPNKCLGP